MSCLVKTLKKVYFIFYQMTSPAAPFWLQFWKVPFIRPSAGVAIKEKIRFRAQQNQYIA